MNKKDMFFCLLFTIPIISLINAVGLDKFNYQIFFRSMAIGFCLLGVVLGVDLLFKIKK